ncbi:MAG: two-component system, NarL family, sensor kinase [Baekduia sp.]|jgi:signal transduction histidine kinase|nr:two-component system, NarL family, sensor kinase [Baekduia sp.]
MRVCVWVDPTVGEVDDTLLTVARELIDNAAEHSEAGRLDVSVGREECGVVLDVSDDGVGTTPDELQRARAAGHLGLAICAGRVDARGGQFDIDTSRGRGMHVRAEFPPLRRLLRAV